MATVTPPRGLQQPDRKPVRITVPEGRTVRYGVPFWPKTVFQSVFYIAAIFITLLLLALNSPAPLQNPADPLNHEAIDPKPEWYFMFLFQLLKYFPGNFILVGTAIIPGILSVLLVALPFYDRNWARKAARRPVAMASMSIAMMAVIFLTWGGIGFPTPSFNTTSETTAPVGGTSGSISPQVSAIFTAHCAACHISQKLGGLNLSNYAGLLEGGNVVKGSVVKPGDHANSVIYQIISAKGSWPGGARMPLGGPYLADADIKTIGDWIDKLPSSGSTGNARAGGSGGTTSTNLQGGAVPASPAAGSSGGSTSGGAAATVSFKKDIQTVFTAHCAACHMNGVASGGLNLGDYAGLQKGGAVVPGSVFKAGDHANSVLWKIVQPGGNWPGGARMPLGGPYLGDDQIKLIANWIDQGAKDN